MAEPRIWTELLTYGLGVALSPIHIVLLLLLLLGTSPLRRGGLFLSGWLLTSALTVIGLLTLDPEAWFKGEEGEDDAAIDAMVRERDEARQNRDFARADELRDKLAELGIVLEDGAGETRWRRG